MQRSLPTLAARHFDLIVIGGGITGACLAHDASLRGLDVALIERGDFGAATSSASSKLLHGGIRYLQQLRADKVVESLRERAIVQQIAPHLSHWVPFLIPTYGPWLRGRHFLAAGLTAFRALQWWGEPAGLRDSAREPPGRYYDRADLRDIAAPLCAREDVTGAHLIHECHVHSTERLTLAFVASAAAHGATVANYLTVDGLLGDRRVTGVRVVDGLGDDTFEVRGRVVVNAGGPWIGELTAQWGLRSLPRPLTGLARGVHLVIRPIFDDVAVALPTTRGADAVVGRGGRHVFAIPWRGHTLLGTSNTPYPGRPDGVAPTDADIDQLLEDVSGALPSHPVTRDDVRHAFAGLYPLTARRVRPDTYQGTGDYQIVDHAVRDGVAGLVTALGAKYTTARGLAERVMRVVERQLDRTMGASRTATTPLLGGDIDDVPSYAREVAERHRDLVPAATVRHLVRSYGRQCEAVLALVRADPSLGLRLSAARESIGAEVAFAVDHELAWRLDDVVFRRTGLGTLGDPGPDTLERCAAIMASRLAWSAAEAGDEVRRTQSRFLFPTTDAA